jgi:hypothetical protein
VPCFLGLDVVGGKDEPEEPLEHMEELTGEEAEARPLDAVLSRAPNVSKAENDVDRVLLASIVNKEDDLIDILLDENRDVTPESVNSKTEEDIVEEKITSKIKKHQDAMAEDGEGDQEETNIIDVIVGSASEAMEGASDAVQKGKEAFDKNVEKGKNALDSLTGKYDSM